jgi:hypothetical protein
MSEGRGLFADVNGLLNGLVCGCYSGHEEDVKVDMKRT